MICQSVDTELQFKGSSPPHDQLMVVSGLQYAALAKNVNGLNVSIWDAESAVIDWRRVALNGDE